MHIPKQRGLRNLCVRLDLFEIQNTLFLLFKLNEIK